MENKNNTPAVQDTAKHTNPIKRFFSVLNGKRQKIALSVMTAISFAMVNTIYAFAEGEDGGATGVNAGDEAFFSVLGFFCTWIGRIGLVIAFVGGIYEGFCSLGSTITADQLTQDFLPTGSELYSYFLTTSEVAKLDDLVSFLSLNPLMISMKITVIGWLLMITLIISNIVVIGRVFELAIYTLIAPIPLATLACDGLQDVGKNFLKSYVAVSIQAVVLILMFMTYNAVSSSTQFQQMLSLVQDWRAIIMCLVLGLSVMQSGQWAKRIVGSM